jgi:hypothetical protein
MMPFIQPSHCKSGLSTIIRRESLAGVLGTETVHVPYRADRPSSKYISVLNTGFLQLTNIPRVILEVVGAWIACVRVTLEDPWSIYAYCCTRAF